MGCDGELLCSTGAWKGRWLSSPTGRQPRCVAHLPRYRWCLGWAVISHRCCYSPSTVVPQLHRRLWRITSPCLHFLLCCRASHLPGRHPPLHRHLPRAAGAATRRGRRQPTVPCRRRYGTFGGGGGGRYGIWVRARSGAGEGIRGPGGRRDTEGRQGEEGVVGRGGGHHEAVW